MKKIFTCFLCVTLLAAVLTGCGSKGDDSAQADTGKTESTDTDRTEGTDTGNTKDAEQKKDASSEEEAYLEGLHHVEIEVQDYGTIALELDADTAPISVTNFIDRKSTRLNSSHWS